MDSTRCRFGVVGTDAETVGKQQLVVVSVGGFKLPWSESNDMAFWRDCVRVGVFGVGGCCRESTPEPSGWYSSCLRSIFNWFLFLKERRVGPSIPSVMPGGNNSSVAIDGEGGGGWMHSSCKSIFSVSSTALADSESREIDLRRALRIGEFRGASGNRVSWGDRMPRVSVSLGVEQLDNWSALIFTDADGQASTSGNRK